MGLIYAFFDRIHATQSGLFPAHVVQILCGVSIMANGSIGDSILLGVASKTCVLLEAACIIPTHRRRAPIGRPLAPCDMWICGQRRWPLSDLSYAQIRPRFAFCSVACEIRCFTVAGTMSVAPMLDSIYIGSPSWRLCDQMEQ